MLLLILILVFVLCRLKVMRLCSCIQKIVVFGSVSTSDLLFLRHLGGMGLWLLYETLFLHSVCFGRSYIGGQCPSVIGSFAL